MVIYMMTRKDFNLFAEMFGLRLHLLNQENENLYGFNMALIGFCDICREINPRFDRERFIARMNHYANQWDQKEEYE